MQFLEFIGQDAPHFAGAFMVLLVLCWMVVLLMDWLHRFIRMVFGFGVEAEPDDDDDEEDSM